MNIELSEDQRALVQAIESVCQQFDDEYWLARDQDGVYPHDFHKALADGGWLGIAMPEQYGGAGLGMMEAALMMHTISRTGAGFSGASAVHMNIFGLNPVVVFGNDEQRARFLPPLIQGKDKACFGVTEPISAWINCPTFCSSLICANKALILLSMAGARAIPISRWRASTRAATCSIWSISTIRHSLPNRPTRPIQP